MAHTKAVDIESLVGETWSRLRAIVRQIDDAVTAWRANEHRDLVWRPEYDGADWDLVGTEILEGIDREMAATAKYLRLGRRYKFRQLDGDDGLVPADETGELAAALDQVKRNIAERDRQLVRESINTLQLACDDVGISTKPLFDAAAEVLDLFEVSEPTLLWTPERSIHLPTLVVRANDELLRFLANNPRFLYQLAPRKFEELIAELFAKQGYEIQLTRATRDGGRDIIAIEKRMDVVLKILIECKRYAERNKVSLAIVQRLYGVKIAEAANKALLVTTSTFTRDARAFASAHLWDIELKDRHAILNWLAPYAR